MMGEILYFAHKHFRAIFIVATVTAFVLGGIGMLESKPVWNF